MDRNELLAACRAEFLHHFTASLDELIQRSIDHLFDRADCAPSLPEQGHLLDARAVLLKYRDPLRQRLIANMERLLNRSFQTAYSTFRPSFTDGYKPSGGLSLMDVSALEDELHIDEVTKRFHLVAEEQLRDINIRVALLFEQDEIRERENPFRPYLLARCVALSVDDLDTEPAVVLPLNQQLTDELQHYVQNIYARLNQLLADRGIAAQLQFKIKKTPDSSAVLRSATSEELEVGSVILPTDAAGSPDSDYQALDDGDDDWSFSSRVRANALLNQVMGGTGGGGVPAESGRQAAPQTGAGTTATSGRKGWLAGAKAVGTVLRNFFTGKFRTEGEEAQTQGIAADLPYQPIASFAPNSPLTESVHSLQLANTPPAASMLHGDGRVRNLILERRHELSGLSRDDEEEMIIDIVAMLFEFILRDGQVPAEVRAQLGRLQFLVLKVALLDPALFSQKSHPARLLVNRIGSIVLGLQQLDPGGERVTAEIRRIVEILLSDITGDVSLFAQMLDEFDAFVANELRSADQNVDRAVQALENAQNRTVQYAHLSGLLSEALLRIKVEEFLSEFLVTTWARVLERAGREDIARAGRLRVLVPDLVWSVIPKPTEQERKQLFGMIPNLLASIREGVALIGWSEEQQTVLLDWLIEAHRRALRAGNLGADVPPLSFVYTCFEEFINTHEGFDEEDTAEFASVDNELLDEAIQEMDAELNQLDQMFDLDMNELMAGPSDEPEFPSDAMVYTEKEVSERLRSGVAIEIMLDETPTRARLSWVSVDSSNMVLTIENVPAPSVLNIKVFRRLLDTGRVRFAENAPLFERAVHSLLESADQLDTHHPVKAQ